jgi:hypothetical protein
MLLARSIQSVPLIRSICVKVLAVYSIGLDIIYSVSGPIRYWGWTGLCRGVLENSVLVLAFAKLNHEDHEEPRRCTKMVFAGAACAELHPVGSAATMH